jgi:hypothetical protein
VKQTLRILDQDQYPICVTLPFAQKDDPILQKFISWQGKKKNPWILKAGANGGWVLWRAITPKEWAEIAAKRYIIRGGGFKIYPEEA